MTLGNGPAAAESYRRNVVFLDIGLLVEIGHEMARDLLQNHRASANVAKAKPNSTVALGWPIGGQSWKSMR